MLQEHRPDVFLEGLEAGLWLRFLIASLPVAPLLGSAGDERFFGDPPRRFVGERSTVETLAARRALFVAVLVVLDLVIVGVS